MAPAFKPEKIFAYHAKICPDTEIQPAPLAHHTNEVVKKEPLVFKQNNISSHSKNGPERGAHHTVTIHTAN